MPTLIRFDAAKYLADECAIYEFLTAALEDSNPYVFPKALQAVTKARIMHNDREPDAKQKGV